MNIVITGASKGLGRAIAEKFAADKQGHSFFLCARNEAALKAFATELQARFPRTSVHAFACNVAVKKEAQAFAQWVLGFNVPLHVLVNNAGQFIPGSIHNEEEGVLEQMIQVNLYSAYYITRALLPRMMQEKAGHIFNMCSIASLQAYANGGAYSISKFALAGFSQNLREELKPHHIKVTAVYPGAAYTDSWSGSGVDPKRIMEANDIAEMVYTASLLSPRACVEEIVLRPQLGDL
jgi:short-subunit dehydrogenase